MTFDALQEMLTRHAWQQVTSQAPRAAVALVLHDRTQDRGDWELLFIRRAAHPQDPWSGHMAFPGGRIEAADPNSRAAAQRECQEELGFDPGVHGRYLGRLSDLQAMASGRIVPLVIEPFLFAVPTLPLLRPDPAEVEEALWIPLRFFQQPEHRSVFDYRHDQHTYALPCYHWQGRRIWGLSLRMLDEFLALLPPPTA